MMFQSLIAELFLSLTLSRLPKLIAHQKRLVHKPNFPWLSGYQRNWSCFPKTVGLASSHFAANKCQCWNNVSERVKYFEAYLGAYLRTRQARKLSNDGYGVDWLDVQLGNLVSRHTLHKDVHVLNAVVWNAGGIVGIQSLQRADQNCQTRFNWNPISLAKLTFKTRLAMLVRLVWEQSEDDPIMLKHCIISLLDSVAKSSMENWHTILEYVSRQIFPAEQSSQVNWGVVGVVAT